MEKSVFTREYDILREMLRDYRQRANLTQTDLADRLNETQSFISKCERGERRLDLVQLRAFCTALQVSLRTFVADFERRCSQE
jgi:transcriptional regulator with XRE-family HTH domain